MHSYCYFRYYQNINYQQVLPQAFAKSLKIEETVTRVCLCPISSNACSKKSQNCLWPIVRNIENINEPSNPMRASRISSCEKWHITLPSVTIFRGLMYWRSPTIKIWAGHNLWLLNQHQLLSTIKTSFTIRLKSSQSAKSACSQQKKRIYTYNVSLKLWARKGSGSLAQCM